LGRFARGRGDIAAARNYYSHSCVLGNAKACLEKRRIAHINGLTPPSTKGKLQSLLTAKNKQLPETKPRPILTPCERGNMQSCIKLADAAKAQGSLFNAESLYFKACQSDLVDACHALGHIKRKLKKKAEAKVMV